MFSAKRLVNTFPRVVNNCPAMSKHICLKPLDLSRMNTLAMRRFSRFGVRKLEGLSNICHYANIIATTNQS